MAEIDATETAREVKPEPPFPRAFIRRGEMYLVEDLVEFFSWRTVATWKKRFKELRNVELVRQPGTRRAFVVSDDLFDLFSSWDGDPQ